MTRAHRHANIYVYLSYLYLSSVFLTMVRKAKNLKNSLREQTVRKQHKSQCRVQRMLDGESKRPVLTQHLNGNENLKYSHSNGWYN